MGKTRTSQITHFLYSSSARRLRRWIGGDLQPRQHPAHLSLLFSYLTRSFLHLSFDIYMLYETRKISLFFFSREVSYLLSAYWMEIDQTLESSKARKSKDEETERRTNKKKAKFRAETIISASVKGRKKQLSRTN